MELRFSCQPNCSNCCQMEGEVYLSEGDLRKAAAFVGLTTKEFEAQFAIRTRNQLRLRKPEGRQCYFHQNNCCAIHPAKPTQCRAFPFWPELLEDAAAWEEASRYCPGMNRGDLIQIEEAQAVSAEMREAYPSMY